MQVILLEKIRNLGNIGDQVKVRAGYARNFLIPKNKASAATKENLAEFEKQRAELEANALAILKAAQERAAKLAKLELQITVKVSEEGRLFGSVGMREIIAALKKLGHEIQRSELSMPHGALHEVGEHEVYLLLHSDVTVPVKVKVVAEEVKS